MMPRFFFTTNDGHRVDIDADGFEFASETEAIEEAQRALRDIAHEQLPDGRHADFFVLVRNENGEEVYRASLTFDGIKRADGKIEPNAGD